MARISSPFLVAMKWHFFFHKRYAVVCQLVQHGGVNFFGASVYSARKVPSDFTMLPLPNI